MWVNISENIDGVYFFQLNYFLCSVQLYHFFFYKSFYLNILNTLSDKGILYVAIIVTKFLFYINFQNCVYICLKKRGQNWRPSSARQNLNMAVQMNLTEGPPFTNVRRCNSFKQSYLFSDILFRSPKSLR